MKILFVFFIIVFGMTTLAESKNPFYKDWKTPFGTPPFSEIEEEHYMPAFKKGMKEHAKEIEKIVNNKKAPTFENTLKALELSGALLTQVSNVFYNMTSAHTNDDLQEISKEVAPISTKHFDDILLNEKLFKRVKTLYVKKDQLGLNTEQYRLLEETYKSFVRGGADLDEKDKEKLREINKEMSLLSLQFGENVLKETNRFELVITDKSDLAGLPKNAMAGAAEAAKEKGYDGKWLFTIHKPSWIPFLQYSEKRELRKKLLLAYFEQGNHNDDLDNKNILSKMAALRVKKANLLGYKTHAHFVLEENMAKTPDKVYELLNQLWGPALNMAKVEAYELQQMIFREGHNFRLEAWDWWYYAEKLKKEKYALDEEMLRPYFKLENVRQGAFDVANKLWGITFEERPDIPVYHPDVKALEVKEGDGTHIGILYVDYFPRASKRGGAWMSEYRQQQKVGGKSVTPIIVNVGNFSKPTGDNPALISFDEANTLFHEFGHALHGLLSNRTYPSLAGTNVARDFVELPSQIMENWAGHPDVIKSYAKHYKTGEPIPDELLDKIEKSGHFNQGFATVEYLAASFLDMDWHSLTEPIEHDVLEFENEAMGRIGIIPEIVVRYKSPYFRHVFSGGYSSGYYSYIWSEVLDSDAFEVFKEAGIYNKEKAKLYRDNILSTGGSEDPMELYKKFRGREPEIGPLLKKRGLK
jgi:peptidyl-dipeptidase Dcp